MCANRFASRGSWAAAFVAAFIVTGILASRIEAKDPPSKPQTAAKADVAKPAAAKPAVAAPAKASARVDGHELFTREWLPSDARAHGGDGLGPVFNDSSCVACHNQGGAGGAGPSSKNVNIITAFTIPMAQITQEQSLPQGLFNLAFGALRRPCPCNRS